MADELRKPLWVALLDRNKERLTRFARINYTADFIEMIVLKQKERYDAHYMAIYQIASSDAMLFYDALTFRRIVYAGDKIRIQYTLLFEATCYIE